MTPTPTELPEIPGGSSETPALSSTALATALLQSAATLPLASAAAPDTLPDSMLGKIVHALMNDGHITLDLALPEMLAAALQRDCQAQHDDAFRPAGIGRERGMQTDASIRTDEICWLEQSNIDRHNYLCFMESLRLGLNRDLFLGLFDYECHFARYLPGARYHTHLDAFEGNRNRVLSTVLYLNDNWLAGQGGELVLYAPDQQTVLETIPPVHNRLVLYLSERFPHEVLPALRPRYSLTGWFRIREEKSWRRPV